MRSADLKNAVRVGDVFLSILPCWHIFERTAEYFCLSRGVQMIYSNLRNFKSDLGVSYLDA
jgi:long-chain acyl-CoA synthetase